MSSQLNSENQVNEFTNSQGKVKVTDLLSRLNEEKKNRKKKKFSIRGCSSVSSDSFWNNSNNLIQNI